MERRVLCRVWRLGEGEFGNVRSRLDCGGKDIWICCRSIFGVGGKSDGVGLVFPLLFLLRGLAYAVSLSFYRFCCLSAAHKSCMVWDQKRQKRLFMDEAEMTRYVDYYDHFECEFLHSHFFRLRLFHLPTQTIPQRILPKKSPYLTIYVEYP